MKIIDCDQGDAAWFAARLGKVTASEAGNILTPKLELKKDKEKVGKYLYRKVAEADRGSPLPGFGSHATEYGQEMEIEARSWFDLAFAEDRMHNVGFIVHDDGRCGCSPDALLGDNGGLEIKCPEPTNHVKYICEGVLPDDYAPQVHFSMYVTGRPWWKFVSYSRKRQFVLTVHRDEKICATIAEALAGFYKRFDEAMAKLKEAA